jgi:hypothetical protein
MAWRKRAKSTGPTNLRRGRTMGPWVKSFCFFTALVFIILPVFPYCLFSYSLFLPAAFPFHPKKRSPVIFSITGLTRHLIEHGIAMPVPPMTCSAFVHYFTRSLRENQAEQKEKNRKKSKEQRKMRRPSRDLLIFHAGQYNR